MRLPLYALVVGIQVWVFCILHQTYESTNAYSHVVLKMQLCSGTCVCVPGSCLMMPVRIWELRVLLGEPECFLFFAGCPGIPLEKHRACICWCGKCRSLTLLVHLYLYGSGSQPGGQGPLRALSKLSKRLQDNLKLFKLIINDLHKVKIEIEFPFVILLVLRRETAVWEKLIFSSSTGAFFNHAVKLHVHWFVQY